MKKISLFLASGLLAAGLYAQHNVTFQVDMANEVVNAAGVSIAGDFQVAAGGAANWTPGALFLTDGDGDKVYSVTVSLPDGSYEYKYINGNAWGQDESVPAACKVGVGNNRGVTVSGADVTIPVHCYGTCVACVSGIPDTLTVTLKVNMANFIATYGNTFSMVSVAGTFGKKAGEANDTTWDDWAPGDIQLTDADGDKVYETSFRLPEGTYDYKYIAGDAWGKDELLTGGNREMVIAGVANGTQTVGPFCFGDKVNDCQALGPISNVTFRVNMAEAHDPDSIFIKGTIKFPGDTKTKMTETTPGSGIFFLTVPLPTGFTYGFKFSKGDSTDEKGGANGGNFAVNGCGLGDYGENRKFELRSGAPDTTLPAFVFSSCAFDENPGYVTAIDGRANTLFTVAPNPFTHRTTVSFTRAGVYNVMVVSPAGQVVSRISDVRSTAVEISREGLNAGLYLLSITDESGNRTLEKIVIE